MAVVFHTTAKHRLLEIWDYTERVWGADQADDYVRGLVESIHAVVGNRNLWRSLPDEELSGIYFIRYRHHYIFFREWSRTKLGVITMLHERMHLPARLKDDATNS